MGTRVCGLRRVSVPASRLPVLFLLRHLVVRTPLCAGSEHAMGIYILLAFSLVGAAIVGYFMFQDRGSKANR